AMLVPREHLPRVAGLNQATKGAMAVAGPVLGALLISILPIHGVMLIDVGTAAFAITPLFFLRIPQPANRSAREMKLFASMRIGFAFVLKHRGLLTLLGIASLANFLLNPIFVLLPLLVTEHFKGTALHLGWLQSGWGIGLAVGGLALSVWGGFRKRVFTFYISGAAQAAALVLLGAVPAGLFPVALVALSAHGFFNAFHNGSLSALIQSVVPKHMLGRVGTLMESMLQSIYPISLAVVGPVVAIIGLRTWYVVGALVMVCVQLGALFVPSLRNLEAHMASDPDQAPETIPAD
ncbi:MFS transporter, partial [Candidatus Bipolaricaulota bacterium]|nr:MFS transporter [Candidatus Bipolaricaulota bacterium]